MVLRLLLYLDFLALIVGIYTADFLAFVNPQNQITIHPQDDMFLHILTCFITHILQLGTKNLAGPNRINPLLEDQSEVELKTTPTSSHGKHSGV